MDSHIQKKYEVEKRLGKGAYGIVWKATSKRSGRVVAVKKIFDAFRNKTDAQRTFREIVFLKEFSDHPNVVKLLNVHRAENDRDLYLVFEFMNTDLHHVIRKGDILKKVHKRFIMYQLFRATNYLHSGNVIHRDQKPSNVLLDCECNCKIADFGLARSLTSLAKEVNGAENGSSEANLANGCLTDYVATRWYRAPEILLGKKNYTKGVDMWSLGCILAEMIAGKPLFPGKNTMDQINKIYQLLDRPREKGSQSQNTKLEESLGPDCDIEAVDLIRRLLSLSPEKRFTANRSLSHPYVRQFYTQRDVNVTKENVVPPLSDDIQLSVPEYKEKLYELIQQYKSSSKKVTQQPPHPGGKK